jgi:uncharacterized protein (DUF1499 family)
MIKKLLFVVVLAAVAWLLLAWPWLNSVETGRTPQYPDLQPRQYDKPPAAVAEAVHDAIAALPRFEGVGSGSGPAGIAIHAVARTRVFRFRDDVTVRVFLEKGRTHLSISSRSQLGKLDFGQNARNVRELLAELDGRIAPVPR